MSFLSSFGLTGNANFDPMQMNQNAQMLRQQVGQWLQQQNSQLSMQAVQNPQAAQLLRNLNESTNNLLNDPVLPMLQQIDSIVQTAPQPVQKELKDRIMESFEGMPKSSRMQGSTGRYGMGTPGMGSSGYGMGSSGYGMGSPGMGSSGYGMGSNSMGSSGYGMGSSGYGMGSSGMGSSGYGMGSNGMGTKRSTFGGIFGGKIGRKSRKMKGGLRLRRGGLRLRRGGSCKMKGGSCKSR
jgi:hypothetical protein